jgi:DNA-binding LacI/PurR family transcriptional regulator
MRALIEREPELDAVFAANDLMALGAIRVLHEQGRQVPGDVAVVGFDDIAEAATAVPALTTVAQDIEEMGRRLAELLLARLAGREQIGQEILPTHLVVRDSS